MTPFAKKVYRAVLEIPVGEVRSYKWVAKKAGKPNAFRAVGQILKSNPYPLIIPCHRVVNCGKGIGGYVMGISCKKSILDLESRIKQCLLSKE